MALLSPYESRDLALSNPKAWNTGLWNLWGAQSKTGLTVNEGTAMTFSAVYSCIKLLADTVASLPLHLYKKNPDGSREKVGTRRIVQVLKNPNPDMSSFRFLNTLQGHLGSWGNSYSWVQRDSLGRVLNLYPLRPDRMMVRRDERGKLYYEYINPGGENVIFSDREVFHVPGFGYDGMIGYSPITLAREGIGLGMATEEFGARYFGQGSHPGMIVKHPGKLSGTAHESLKKDITEKAQGLGKSHQLMLLEEGMDVVNIGIPNDDSQFLETRKFQVTEICRFWRVPPHLVYDLERATYSNIEFSSMEFVTHSLRPWLVLWEQELSRYFLQPSEWNTFYFEFKIDGLLRGDTKTRYESYVAAANNGIMNRNEIRALENLDPGGPELDEFTVPMNLTTMEKLLEEPEPVELPPQLQIEGPPEEEEERKFWRRLKLITHRSANGRARITNSYKPLFKDAAKVIVNREINQVGRGVTKHLGERQVENLEAYLDDFYDKFGTYIEGKLKPVVMSFAEVIQAEAAREIGAAEGITEALQEFLDDYLATYSKRHIFSSKGQLRSLIRENEADALVDSLRGRLEEWGDKRAGKIADNEAVRVQNAITRETFIEGGIRKLKWVATGTSTCPFCKKFDGRVVNIQKPFIDGSDGEEFIKIKGQPWMKIQGAHFHPPLHQGCFPGNTDVLSVGGVSAYSKRWFDGDLVIIHTASGNQLSCTPNHPILTDNRWVPAHSLNIGDYVINSGLSERNSSIIAGNQDIPTSIKNAAESSLKDGLVTPIPMPSSREDFHGDGRDGEVAIIYIDSRLLSELHASGYEPIGKPPFMFRYPKQFSFMGSGTFKEFLPGGFPPQCCPMCSSDLVSTFGGVGSVLPDQLLSRTVTTGFNSSLQQKPPDDASTHFEMLRQGKFGFTGSITLDKVTDVLNVDFSGHVYNLHSESNVIVAQNIITHNCDCTISAA